MENNINFNQTDEIRNTAPNDTEEVEKESIDPCAVLMDKPFDPSKINIETKTPSLDTLISRIERNSIQMNTETYFQRGDDLWDDEKQSRLIESILIQFPLPAFFFDATDDNNWLVVDGLQRLSSIRNFVVNKKLKLTGLEFLTQLNGVGWDNIGENLQRTIKEAQVVIYKIMPGTPTDVKFNIFKRINTGGLVLEPQEIRHALFQGKPADFIAELAQSKEFLEATNSRIPTRRMSDRDFANRFLAFYLLGVENYGTKEYGQDLDTYMSKAMASIYDKSPDELERIKYDFKEAMILSEAIFKREAFRKCYQDYHYSLPPINKALFDVISVQFALLNDNERAILKKHREDVKKELRNLLNSKDGKFFVSVSSSTGEKSRVTFRHEEFKKLVNNIIGK